MTKRLSALCSGVILFFTLFAFTFTASAKINDTDGISYTNFHNGIVDGSTYNTATISSETSWDLSFFWQTCTKITPNPQGAPDKPVSLDHYTLTQHNINAAELKYISVYCKYEGSKTLGKARITLQPHSGKYYTETVIVESNEDIKSGTWQWLNFDVGSAAYGKVTGATLFQFHLSPYGSIKSGELSSSDVMKIGKIRFLNYNNASSVTGVYPISFTSSRPDVTGENPETIYATVGSTITLPENPYTRENHEFVGWICSADNQVYQPQSTYTVKERTRATGSLLYNTTGEAIFFPDWKYVGEAAPLPETLSVQYTDYYNAMLGNKDYFTATKNYNFMGRNTVKLEILPSSSDPLLADGWTWQNMPFDLDKYKYCTITYFVDTDKSFATAYSYINTMTKDCPSVTKTVTLKSEYPFVTGQWAVMGFDLTAMEDALNPELDSHVLRQFHLYITGHSKEPNKIKASDFNEGDAIYLDTLTLYTEKPQGDLRIQQGLMVGDGNGNLRPHDAMTRAEAAQLIANVLVNEGKITKIPEKIEMTFSDVAPTDWFYYAVMGLDSLGYVPEDGLFRPFDKITVAEFMRMMFFIERGGLDKASFTAHAGNTSYLTRAQAAMILSDFLTNGIPNQLYESVVKPFDDIDIFSAEYLPMMNICATRLSSFDKDGNETIYQLLCPGSSYNSLDYKTGDTAKYIKELDALENQRIEEIRNSESVYATKGGGRIYYVSSSEGTANGGDSEDNPKLISALSELTGMGTNGDVILFKRGDIFRGNFTATAGVTYSAYGEGEKPKLYRSEKNHTGGENWSIYYQDEASDKTIWKTNYEVSTDAGAITINDGEIIGLKEIPSYLSGVYYVRGQENTTVFDLVTELDNNHEFFHDIGGNVNGGGIVYFRCDEGNPGELYESIEMNQRVNCLRASSNVTVDNLCIKYFGSHGIGAGTVSNLTITNCEIGWGGGSIQHFNANGTVTRFGNGVEIYGGLVNYTIDNCYVYEIYDAGITHQISTSTQGNYYMKDVVYSNNVLCDSTYNIEYFMSIDSSSATNERFMENVLFENNLIRRAGYGWGQQRPDDAPAGIKGWTHHNNAVNTILRNNIIDRCYNHVGGLAHLIQMGTTYNAAGPFLEGNTFIQVPGRHFAYIHKTDYRYGYNVEHTINNIIGGKDNKIYYASEDYGTD